MNKNPLPFRSRSLLTFSDAVAGTTFPVGFSAGGLIWTRPVLVRAVMLSSSFVGNSTTSVATSRGEVFAVRTTPTRQQYDAGSLNVAPGNTLLTGAGAFQRSLDGILLAQSFSYVDAGTTLAKCNGIAWDPIDAWELGLNESITCFQSGDFQNNVLRTIMTVHFNFIEEWENSLRSNA